MLTIIPTPIGNLGDISVRAIEQLKQVDFLLAEDTRVSGRLLKHFGITVSLRSYHIKNEHRLTSQIVDELKEGACAGLITDAGTPGISDPGYLLVRACIDAGVNVQCLPGATAFVPALILSGLPNHHFFFEGFLPHKKGRQTRLAYLASLEDTFILYESPHRIHRCLRELSTICGAERSACLCRELTKMHEEVVRGSLIELVSWAEERARIRGEIVVVVGGSRKG
ncbi:MAG: 16S rRNA (cytidine(1402)-2'-O)-methyltransferase [Saprospiraceae bacterium]|nr:16S rRNA (cytidine(1402)-2'-O)-methyltransferase [Saprospiraceae bacterium]